MVSCYTSKPLKRIQWKKIRVTMWIFVFFSWKQAGIGAAWRPTEPRRSCRTRQKARFWSGTARRGTTSSPSPPWRLPDPPTCGSSSRTASSSWTPWCWSSPNSSSSTAWCIWWSTTFSCPGRLVRGGLLLPRQMARCSSYWRLPCTQPYRLCNTCVESPSTRPHGRFGNFLCRTGWRTI